MRVPRRKRYCERSQTVQDDEERREYGAVIRHPGKW